MLALAFDTATDVATVALVHGGEPIGERQTTAGRLLTSVDELLAQAGCLPADLGGIVVGRGPGRYTSLRMGLVTARALAFSLDVGAAGVSTLHALQVGGAGALPVIDARRREVFTLAPGPVCVRPEALELEADRLCVGDGALRYRGVLEAAGAVVPPDGDPRHVPWARHHVRLATELGSADSIEPIYLRAPDADRALPRA
jgi:tRNA threonylcarbamoyladenosine biosynthesis protein TsaB